MTPALVALLAGIVWFLVYGIFHSITLQNEAMAKAKERNFCAPKDHIGHCVHWRNVTDENCALPGMAQKTFKEIYCCRCTAYD